jgi:ribosomal protein S1
MSWGRIGHPSEILKVGQEIDVVVSTSIREKERVSLGLKQKLQNPWENIEQKYQVGMKVKGKVVNLVPYGAFHRTRARRRRPCPRHRIVMDQAHRQTFRCPQNR